jgi:hypothetical protein
VIAEGEDPINYLGFGISSYFQMLKVFMVMFGILFLVHLPIMNIYGKYGAYKEEPLDKSTIKISMGAMGFAKTKCTSTGIATDKIVVSCQTGVISQFLDFGFAAKFEDRDQCIRNATGACATSFNRTKLGNDLESSCVGKA